MYFTQNSCLNGIATLNDKDVDTWISNSSSQDWESIKKSVRSGLFIFFFTQYMFKSYYSLETTVGTDIQEFS